MPLLLAACDNENYEQGAQLIDLTTPSIEIEGVAEVTTRAAEDGAMEQATLDLYIHSSAEGAWSEGDRKGLFAYDGSSWSVTTTVRVNDGPGNYYAGIYATIDLNANGDIPAIAQAQYGYRGVIDVRENGFFFPKGELELCSAALMFHLYDHKGVAITSEEGRYIIEPMGVAKMDGFANSYPNGNEEPVGSAATYEPIDITTINGNYTPGTYPAIWTDGRLTTLAVPAEAWQLFRITYCAEGFAEGNVNSPLGPYVVWNVSYPAEQLVLEGGKLYDFIITLNNPAEATRGMDGALNAYSATCAVVSI